MAIDNSPPRLRLIGTIAVLTLVTLVALEWMLRSTSGYLTDPAMRGKLAPPPDPRVRLALLGAHGIGARGGADRRLHAARAPARRREGAPRPAAPARHRAPRSDRQAGPPARLLRRRASRRADVRVPHVPRHVRDDPEQRGRRAQGDPVDARQGVPRGHDLDRPRGVPRADAREARLDPPRVRAPGRER